MGERANRANYACFGLVVASDFALPFPLLSADVAADIRLVSGRVREPAAGSRLVHDVVDWAGGPRLEIFREAEGGVLIRYDVWRILLDHKNRQVIVESLGADGSAAQTGFELVMERLALPLYVLFGTKHTLGLHGSAVWFGGKAWVFIGESGAGKSTTAHALLERGGRLLADDMSIVDVEKKVVRSGSPSIRLWKGSDEVAGAVLDRQIHAQTTKRWFRMADEQAVAGVVELGGVIWLHPTEDANAEGLWKRCQGREGLVALLKQTFDFTQPEKAWMTARFQNANRFLKSVPMFQYRYRHSETGEPTHVEGLVTRLGSTFVDRWDLLD